MENPDSTHEDFDSIFAEIMEDNKKDSDTAFGTVMAIQDNLPGLFEPRSVEMFKQQKLQKDAKADVEHLTEFDVLMDDLSGVHAARMNLLLGNMTTNNFVINYQRLLAYSKPRFKSIDAAAVEPKELQQINVTVINSKADLKDGNKK